MWRTNLLLTLVSQSYCRYSDLIESGKKSFHDGICLDELGEHQYLVVSSGLRGKLVHPIMCAKYGPIETSSLGGRPFVSLCAMFILVPHQLQGVYTFAHSKV